jgi:phosphatidylinositol alpha-1,6-mannosyltransferase
VDGRTGVLVDARGPDELALALQRMLSSPERAAAMGSAGREWARKRWSWDAAAARLAALLGGGPVPDRPFSDHPLAPRRRTPWMEPAWDSRSS